MNFIFTYVAAKNKAEAEKIGRILVEEKLAACVNIIPQIKSIYRWRGKLEKTSEALLIVKTKKDLKNKIIKRVKALHSYECPAILFLPIVGGSKDYLGWLKDGLK